MQLSKYSRKTGQIKSFAALGENFPYLGSLPGIRINSEFSFLLTWGLSFFLHSIHLYVIEHTLPFMGFLALQVTLSCFVWIFLFSYGKSVKHSVLQKRQMDLCGFIDLLVWYGKTSKLRVGCCYNSKYVNSWVVCKCPWATEPVAVAQRVSVRWNCSSSYSRWQNLLSSSYI